MKNNKIPIMDLINFCEGYNSIGFGKASITELKSHFIVELYNAGYSENEELDLKFKDKYNSCIIMNRHPIIIAEFSKLNLIYNFHIIDFEDVKLGDYNFYRERDTFRYLLEIR